MWQANMNSFSHGAVLSILSVSLAKALNLEPLQHAGKDSQSASGIFILNSWSKTNLLQTAGTGSGVAVTCMETMMHSLSWSTDRRSGLWVQNLTIL